MVEVILLERVEKLGQMGQVVKVRPGFARNYLLPQKKALRATKENMAYFEKQRAQLEAQNLARRGEAEQVAKKLEGVSVVTHPPGRRERPALRLGDRPRHRRGRHRGGLHHRPRPGRARQGDQDARPAPAARRAASRGRRCTVTVNVAQSAEEAEMQAKGVDPARLAQAQAARDAAAAAEAVAASAPEAGAPAAETK